jgi:Rieske Fe-S protein
MCCDSNDGKTRRDFMSELAGGLALGIAAPLLSRSGLAAEGRPQVLATVKIDEHQEFQKPGGSVVVKKTPAGDLLVVRSGEGAFCAFSIVCPHLQCNVKVTSPTMIQCPCHKSGYSIDGSYISGPAKTGLRKFPVSVDGGVITISE